MNDTFFTNDLLIILAVSVIIIGFLVLVGVALWLAAERRRHLSAGQPSTASQTSASQEKPAVSQPAAAAAAPGAATDQAGKTTSADATLGYHSGEYPAAALYDQTLLPQPPTGDRRPPPK